LVPNYTRPQNEEENGEQEACSRKKTKKPQLLPKGGQAKWMEITCSQGGGKRRNGSYEYKGRKERGKEAEQGSSKNAKRELGGKGKVKVKRGEG